MKRVTGRLLFWEDNALVEQIWIWTSLTKQGAVRAAAREQRRSSRLFDACIVDAIAPVATYSALESFLARRTIANETLDVHEFVRLHFNPATTRSKTKVDHERQPLPDPDLMSLATFWSVMGSDEGENTGQKVARIEQSLQELDVSTIMGFAERLSERLWSLDTESLFKKWDGSALGPDGFLYARCWAVLGGPARFESAPKARLGPAQEVFDAEFLLSVADNALHAKGAIRGHYDAAFPIETGTNASQWGEPSEGSIDSKSHFTIRIGSRHETSQGDTWMITMYSFLATHATAAHDSEPIRQQFAVDFPGEEVVVSLVGAAGDTPWARSYPIWARRAENVAVGALPPGFGEDMPTA